ncbi:MAG: glucose-6-phosphate dehydrogenase, partial [Lentisphaeria bacterium]|nr:glucose-6-phosphate dehydrogenase [Lentisphaeria bacterium]
MKIPDDLTLVIFGASGDLTLRKLIPALLELSKQTMLPKNFSVLGVGRTAMTDDQFQVKMKEGLRLFARENSDSVLNTCDFCNTLHYQQIDTKSATDYEVLAKRIVELNQSGNVLFYLATPPSMYGVITANLKAVNLTTEKAGWRRIIIEKPFGYDLESAIALNAELLENIREHQIYRIDHYLGKETVQNILVTRFGNAIYEPLWNRNYISHIEVTSCENIGVENRGGYYDGSGALRDMLQNHLLQLVGMIAMEPPANADDQSIRNEMLKVFQSFRPLTEDKLKSSVVLGQYTENHDKSGYRNEAGVDPESRTETFVALKFFIDNWRWRGVPFFIRTGKR